MLVWILQARQLQISSCHRSEFTWPDQGLVPLFCQQRLWESSSPAGRRRQPRRLCHLPSPLSPLVSPLIFCSVLSPNKQNLLPTPSRLLLEIDTCRTNTPEVGRQQVLPPLHSRDGGWPHLAKSMFYIENQLFFFFFKLFCVNLQALLNTRTHKSFNLTLNDAETLVESIWGRCWDRNKPACVQMKRSTD